MTAGNAVESLCTKTLSTPVGSLLLMLWIAPGADLTFACLRAFCEGLFDLRTIVDLTLLFFGGGLASLLYNSFNDIFNIRI